MVEKACAVMSAAEEPAYADGLCRRLRDLRLIMQRADDGQSQPRPRCVPRLPESAMTPRRMPTLGSTENVALEVIARLSFTGSIPMAIPAR